MNNEREWLLREKYNGVESPEFFSDIKRLNDGEPIDYVIGFSKFLGCKIDLSHKPLIPRTETEYWVEKAIEENKTDKPIKILDIFTGSGCVGIAVLARLPNAQADFADIDPAFIEQTKMNCEINHIQQQRYQTFVSDVFTRIPEKKYDIIFANPPYIGKEKNWTDQSVVAHEPHQALFAENGGMALIRKLIGEAHNYLSEKGVLYIEHDHDQVEEITQVLTENNFSNFVFNKDQFGLYRWVAVYSS